MEYKDTYLSEEGNKYPVMILREYERFYDIEFDPEVDHLTMFKVRKDFILKDGK